MANGEYETLKQRMQKQFELQISHCNAHKLIYIDKMCIP